MTKRDQDSSVPTVGGTVLDHPSCPRLVRYEPRVDWKIGSPIILAMRRKITDESTLRIEPPRALSTTFPVLSKRAITAVEGHPWFQAEAGAADTVAAHLSNTALLDVRRAREPTAGVLRRIGLRMGCLVIRFVAGC